MIDSEDFVSHINKTERSKAVCSHIHDSNGNKEAGSLLVYINHSFGKQGTSSSLFSTRMLFIMEELLQRILNWLLLYFMFPFLLEAAGIETFVSKDIEDFELCPLVDGPSLNITHKEEYESITVCWRFLTTAYPHCAGSWGVPFAVEPYPEGAKYTFMFLLYPPISGMSQDGKHAAWMGVSFEETSEGKGHQITWRSILFDKPLKIFEWQSMCVSYSKQTKKFLVFHNGVKYVDILIKEDHIFISKYFLSQIIINRQQRGSFSDLQVYSTPMDEASLSSWTTCTYNEAGDVYAWDISKFNLTHDETIISAIEEVDTSLFCKSNQK